MAFYTQDLDPQLSLTIAQKVAAVFREECKAADIPPEPEILVLALYACTCAEERRCLFPNGFK